jgi:diguanylate cyclase (GGDEF)-like protein
MRTIALAVLMLAGGMLAGITVLLPPAGTGSDTVVLVVGAASAATGAVVLALRRSLPEWLLGLIAVGGTVLVTVATFEGGAHGTGTDDNEMLYIWICLFSFYFFTFRHALLQLAGVGVAYAILLHAQNVALDDAATRMVVSLSTLLVTGVLVARLRHWLDGSMSDLTDRARLDSLSGLLNRRALEERAVAEFARQRRDQTTVGMLIVDIDGFKALNDSAGHHAGDEVLRKVARVLETETREVDVVARVGGDEFAILLPGASNQATSMIATRLCDAVRAKLAKDGIGLAVSIGTAVAPTAGDSLEDLWQAADGAMYTAKRGGGNSVSSSAADRRLTAVTGPPGVEP